MMTVESEIERRIGLSKQLLASIDDLQPSRLRQLGIYGGAQGIWIDKDFTAKLVPPDGVTVSILHTGRHYADELSDDGLIYHYPKTERPPSRDLTEVEATKNAMRLQIPIFVVLPGANSRSMRRLRLGWVTDFDDQNSQFLILFDQNGRPQYQPAENPESQFILESNESVQRASVTVRKNQQRFRFQVMQQYGCKCAVCEITHPELLKAAHIRGKPDKGCDDWRNGLPLCSTHHDAFDAHLFCIEPDTLIVRTKPNLEPKSLGLTVKKIVPQRNLPHPEAIGWRWSEAQKAWFS